jgi:hypothetical protein
MCFQPPCKTVNGHSITLDLIPKQLPSESHTLNVEIHGDALDDIPSRLAYPTYANLYPLVLIRAQATLVFSIGEHPSSSTISILHSAVILAPICRLLHEVKCVDILSDRNDSFNWIHSDLHTFISKSTPNVEVDTKKILVYGDSAVPYKGTENFEETLKGLEGGKERIYISI